MRLEEAKNYKTRIGVGTNEKELEEKTKYNLVSESIENMISDELETVVKESDDYEESLREIMYNDLYGNYETENTKFDTQLSAMCFPSDMLKKDLDVKVENYPNSTIYSFSPIILEHKNPVTNDIDIFFVNLGPDVSMYKADNEDAEKMTKIIDINEGFESPYLSFYIDETNYQVNTKNIEKQTDVDKFEDTGKFQANIENFFAKIGMVIPVEKNLTAILKDEYTIQQLQEVANTDILKMTPENTNIYIDNTDMKFVKEAKNLPITYLLENYNELRLNAKSIEKMENLEQELSDEKVNYNKEEFKKNFEKLLTSNIDYDVTLDTFAEDKMFKKSTYSNELEQIKETIERD